MMKLSDKIFVLKSVRPFDLLRDGELALIAQAARERRYAPGEMICNADKPLHSLHVVADGSVGRQPDGFEPRVFGVVRLLFNEGDDVFVAGPAGATCLLIKRGNFFTIANECPSLLVGFMDMAERGNLD